MSRGDDLQLELTGDPAVVRITVGQKRAVLRVLGEAAKYTTPDALAEAIAVAVVSDGDDKTRYAIAVLEPGNQLWVYGPYASYGTAAKVAASGHCGTKQGAKAKVVPLVTSPKSLVPKKAPAKKATGSTTRKVHS